MGTREKIRDLNGLLRIGRKGLHKVGLLKEKGKHAALCDYLQKINYSVQDMNYEIEKLDDVDRKNCIYLVILTTWIHEALNKVISCYKKDVIDKFIYSREKELESAQKYIMAVRSFVVAHPLSTNRHSDFELNGNYICIDIVNRKSDLYSSLIGRDWVYYMDFEGLHHGENDDAGVVLYVYSEKDDGMHYYRYILIDIKDVFHVADLLVDKLYELDKFLVKQKCR